MSGQGATPFGWLGIVPAWVGADRAWRHHRVTTSTLNRVIVVELALPAFLPGLLVGWHYALQIFRPRWGYGADRGRRATPWIIGGMGLLSLAASPPPSPPR